MTAPIVFTIRAFAASKANSRRIVNTPTGALRVVKSKAALAFVRDCKLQCPKRADLPFREPVRLFVRMYYPNERADLDESALLDALQSGYTGTGKARVMCWPGLWENDRLVRERHVYHAVDAADPRIEACAEPLSLPTGAARGLALVDAAGAELEGMAITDLVPAGPVLDLIRELRAVYRPRP